MIFDLPHIWAGIIAFAIALAVALAAVGALVWLGLPKHWNGGLVVVLSIVLLLMGIPVGVAMLGAAVLGLWVLSGARVVRSTLERAAYDAAESWSYSVIPMFILMGMILWKSGLTASAFEAALRATSFDQYVHGRTALQFVLPSQAGKSFDFAKAKAKFVDEADDDNEQIDVLTALQLDAFVLVEVFFPAEGVVVRAALLAGDDDQWNVLYATLVER